MADNSVVAISPKAPAEIIPLDFNFGNVTGDIASAVIAVSVVSGVDAAVGSMPLGAYQISESDVKQLIQAGLDGVIYRIRCDVTNTAGEKYAKATYLQVKELG